MAGLITLLKGIIGISATITFCIPFAFFAAFTTLLAWLYLISYIVWVYLEAALTFVPNFLFFRWRRYPDDPNIEHLRRHNNHIGRSSPVNPASLQPVSPGRFPPLPSHFNTDQTPPRRRNSITVLTARLSAPDAMPNSLFARDYEGLGGPKWDDSLRDGHLTTMKRRTSRADPGEGSSRTVRPAAANPRTPERNVAEADDEFEVSPYGDRVISDKAGRNLSAFSGPSPRDFGTFVTPHRRGVRDNLTGRVPPTIVEGDSEDPLSPTLGEKSSS
ncbi:hypothetical protein C8A03DRAFT_33928 [Achaetomium macrosporum]|uniref:Uncharacterized protein n=1 Tax=Achaetomium macrosporum TaxID=79813 RepID=A0AAN7C9W9_9PEZI|nr:hypothetical protein C8A03DRAFT_33928 [Achaetomium macrosporum]